MAKSKHESAPITFAEPLPTFGDTTLPNLSDAPTQPGSPPAEGTVPNALRAKFTVHSVELRLVGDGYKIAAIRLAPNADAPFEIKAGDEITIEVVPPPSAPVAGWA